MKKVIIVVFVALCHQTACAMYSLHLAAGLGDIKLLKALINANADVNEYNAKNETPLLCAVIKNRVAAVELLLNNGANPNKSYHRCWPPLWYAVDANRAAIVDLLLKHGAHDIVNSDGKMLFHVAAEKGYAVVVKSFLKNGFDVNGTDPVTGWAPLHYAADGGRLKVVRLLLEHHADRDLRIPIGYTPTYLAVLKDHNEVADLLKAWPKIQCTQARIALMLGLHPRAGAASSLNVLDQHLLHTIAEYICPEDY